MAADIAAIKQGLLDNDTSDREREALITAILEKLADAPASTGPSVSGISPTSGSVNGGETITVNGSNLGLLTDVKFGTVSGSNLTLTSPTSLTVTAPALPAGNHDVTVVDTSGTSAVVTEAVYTTA
jgi:hypothetical protein